MDADERPLLVQLNWTTDNREGRFVLKRDQESSKVGSRFFQTPAPLVRRCFKHHTHVMFKTFTPFTPSERTAGE